MNLQKGTSLLEVVIAVIILSFASTLLLLNSRTSAAGNQRSQAYSEAASATKEVFESLQQLPMDSLERIHGRTMPHSQSADVKVIADVRDVSPADVDDFAAQDTSSLRRVSLRTTFSNHAGDQVTKSFSTILYKP